MKTSPAPDDRLRRRPPSRRWTGWVGMLVVLLALSGCATTVGVRPRSTQASVTADLPQLRALAAVPADARERWLRANGIDLRLEGTGRARLRELLVAEDQEVLGLHPRATVPGRGLAVALHLAPDPQLRWTRFLPPEGYYVAGSAVFERGGGRTLLRLIQVGDRRTTAGLSTDHTLPWAWLNERARGLAGAGFSGLLRPTHAKRRAALYLLDPYAPDKIPLLMVHGLQATPLTFVHLTNAIRADPALRARFQIWQYHYPTGTPVLYNALGLRRTLDAALRQLDPTGRQRAVRELVVLGHSMGGLLSHTLVSSSGEALWRAISRVPLARIRGDPALARQWREMMVFRADRRVRRALFLATPHRGSALADGLVGRLGNALVAVPTTFGAGLAEFAAANLETLQPEVTAYYRRGRLSAIQALSARSPALLALADLPVGVPFHSIIGQRREGPVETGSDGVVAYRSSHLPGATSELVVRGGHNIFLAPAAEAEVLRILREHLRARRR